MIMLALHLLFGVVFLFPHGDLDLRIAEISQQIKTHPDSLPLYMIRGELYIQHEEYPKAKADFQTCLKNNYRNSRVLMGLGITYLFENLPDSSLYYVNEALLLEPDNTSALELKAKAYLQASRYCEAADAFQKILDKADHPAPLLFIETSAAYMQCDDAENLHSSISVLQTGLEKLPDNRVLQNQLIMQYRHAFMFDKALTLHASIIQKAEFKIRPYMERAVTYMEMGQYGNAKKDLQTALVEWETLPPRKKDLEAMKGLKEMIIYHLSTL